VVTDSEYVLKGYTEWLPAWITRGWRTSAKKPVKNSDLWAEIVAAAERHGQVNLALDSRSQRRPIQRDGRHDRRTDRGGG
jgi:ribonuclease HI